MKTYKKTLIIFVTIGAIAGIAAYIYVFHKPHRNLANEKPVAVTDAMKLFNEYNTDETKANAVYLDKAVEVSGVIAESTTNADGTCVVTLRDGDTGGVSCTLSTEDCAKLKTRKPGDSLVVRGQCTGLLMEVVLEKAVIIK
jgi:hypothetical protein